MRCFHILDIESVLTLAMMTRQTLALLRDTFILLLSLRNPILWWMCLDSRDDLTAENITMSDSEP